MPSSSAARAVGPVRVVPASLGRQLLGLALAFVGVQLVAWAATAAGPAPLLGYAAVGSFAVLNGLYLGGVRLRPSGAPAR